MMEALAMGEYGPYVWSCFGLTLVVLVICQIQANKLHRNISNDIRARIRAMDSEK
jgi:heme exporter protein CcmD